MSDIGLVDRQAAEQATSQQQWQFLQGFSWPYPASPQTPYWGQPTAASNFCEEDYILTAHIAEFINTLTNITYIIYGLHGLLHNLSKSTPTSWARRLPFIGLIFVGICSGAFHASMKYVGCIADGCSMLVATGAVLNNLLAARYAEKQLAVSGAITTVVVVVITLYAWFDRASYMEVTFVSMILTVAVITAGKLTEVKARDAPLYRTLQRLSKLGIICFVSGLAVWLIDNFACPQLISLRRQVGMPWAFVLELHGWWHILTGVGAYAYMILVDMLLDPDGGTMKRQQVLWPITTCFQEEIVTAKKEQ